MKKYDLRPEMEVHCGSLRWYGQCASIDEAVIAALSKRLPIAPSSLLRVWNGEVWHYLSFEAALKLAGYTVKKTKNGFTVV